MVAKSDFDPQRYVGVWYEIARYPVSFQEGCTATTAEYGLLDSDTVSVLNMCRTGAPNGPVQQISGRADIVGPGQLKVRFDNVPFVRGDYVVLWVDDGYQTAVVGTPSGKAGWILARMPTISPQVRQDAEAVLEMNGYDPSPSGSNADPMIRQSLKVFEPRVITRATRNPIDPSQLGQ